MTEVNLSTISAESALDYRIALHLPGTVSLDFKHPRCGNLPGGRAVRLHGTTGAWTLAEGQRGQLAISSLIAAYHA